jgi:hypothetical protein
MSSLWIHYIVNSIPEGSTVTPSGVINYWNFTPEDVTLNFFSTSKNLLYSVLRNQELFFFCEGDHTSEPKSFFARNRDIIDETDIWIATPATKKETGGTWYTINDSRKQKKQRVIVYPDGSIGE